VASELDLGGIHQLYTEGRTSHREGPAEAKFGDKEATRLGEH
jgi:hypothetical protein